MQAARSRGKQALKLVLVFIQAKGYLIKHHEKVVGKSKGISTNSCVCRQSDARFGPLPPPKDGLTSEWVDNE